MTKRLGYRSLTALTALALLVLGGAAGAAEPSANGAEPADAHRVTLITGDVVELTVHADGLEAATVEAAPRGEGLPDASFQIVRTDGDVYVFPSDAAVYVDDKLDRELFNVSKLVEQGFSDAEAGSLPLIVDYEDAVGAPPPAMVKGDTLESIQAATARQPRGRAAVFGRAVAEQARRDARSMPQGDAAAATSGPNLFQGIERIWLDQRVRAALDTSVPHIGAPTAWAAGYDGSGVRVAVLDTGIDASHPDLAGKVAAAQNFTPTADAGDRHGHGTHVAATVAGTGAASGGTRQGVAPGATILNGKVLDDGGFGLDSWVIAGMEWAARDQNADIVNMSLGGGPSDGNDPLSQAVDALTAETGALFVIAAGNIGGTSTVTTPGAASAALTVGAVDNTDLLAGFSSRGPRIGDFAVKPDVTAPGVDIVAARAAGTSLGTPVDESYTRLSGTSMATPHVAGAAALLAQRRPSWGAEELKAAVVSTATPGSYSVYQQGGGRVDAGRAFTQPEVLAAPAPVDLGHFPWPHDEDEPVTKTVTYTNLSDETTTLDLSLAVTGADGAPPAEGMIVVAPDAVTLPPGGSQIVQVTVDTSVGAVGLYGGYLVAQDSAAATVLRTPLGFHKEPEMHNLTVEGIARDGRPATGISWAEVVNAEDTTVFAQSRGFFEGPPTFRVPPGTYSVMGMLFTYDEPQVFALEAAVAGDPELEVTEDATIVLDAREATEFVATADQPTEWRSFLIGTYRAGREQGSWESLLLASPPIKRAFAAPTEPVTLGDFGLRAKPTLMAPEISIALTKPKLELDVMYAFGSKRFDGQARMDAVYAGYGRTQDFQGLDARGKAVVVSRGPLPPVGDPITFVEKVENATQAGAALLIIHNHSPGLLLIGLAGSEIPVLSTTQSQGLQLKELVDAGRVTADVRGVLESPYVYDVMFAERGRILDTHTMRLNRSNTVQIAAEYRSHVESWLAGEAHHAYPPWSGFSFEGVRNVTVPFSRTEYVSTGDTRWWHLAWGSMTNEHIFEASQQDVIRTYPSPGGRSDAWFAQPQRPGIVRAFQLGADDGQPLTRTGNTLSFFIPEFTDDQGRYGFQDGRSDTIAFRLFENGGLIASGGGAFGTVPVSAAAATYRAELDVTRNAPYWGLSTRTSTQWTFASAPPGPGATEAVPLLLVGYDLGKLDSRNRARRGGHQVKLTFQRQQGAAPAAVTAVEAWASHDDGATWAAVPVNRIGGEFMARLTNPAAGYVSLRVRAVDVGGSIVDQTVIRAYGIQ